MKTEVQVATKQKRISNILEESGRLIIAGPCSAESQEQVIETAKALASDGRVHFLRAGIWKPRTMPGSFEGVGTLGFKWLKMAKTITGLPIATEGGSERHVYEARTVSNPFTIQEIADAIRGVDIPIMVKNPLSPDINLWEGAINRFARAGVSQLGSVHRGFTLSGKSILRNNPNWNIPQLLRERMPDIPIICDPSHIAGKTNLVQPIAQRAINMGLNGLMVEVHPNPQQALSDAAQQLTPLSFTTMLNRIIGEVELTNTDELLSELRLEIDLIDDELIRAIANRMNLVKHIAEAKKLSNTDIIQPSRWDSIVQRIGQLANEQGLRPSFIRKLFNSIHKESCNFQHEQILQSAVK